MATHAPGAWYNIWILYWYGNYVLWENDLNIIFPSHYGNFHDDEILYCIRHHGIAIGVNFLSATSGHVRTTPSNERRRYICKVFSHWLRPLSRDPELDGNGADVDSIDLFCPCSGILWQVSVDGDLQLCIIGFFITKSCLRCFDCYYKCYCCYLSVIYLYILK